MRALLKKRIILSEWGLLVTLVSGGVGACSPFPSENIVYEGEHIVYASMVDQALCGGSFVVLDAVVGGLAEELGVVLTAPIPYAFVPPEEYAQHCPADSKACYSRGSDRAIYGTCPVVLHEFVHALAHRGGFDGYLPFEEGLAEVFDFGIKDPSRRLDLMETLENFQLDYDHYYTMSLFVRFCIERYGLGDVLDFMRRVRRARGLSRVRSAFVEVFGEQLDVVARDFESYPSCSPWQNRIAVYECSEATEVWTSPFLDIDVSFDCARDDVLGPQSLMGRDYMWTVRSFDVDDDGVYGVYLESEGDPDVIAMISGCGSCADQIEVRPVNDGSIFPELRAGRYRAMLFKRLDRPGDVRLTVYRQIVSPGDNTAAIPNSEDPLHEGG